MWDLVQSLHDPATASGLNRPANTMDPVTGKLRFG